MTYSLSSRVLWVEVVAWTRGTVVEPVGSKITFESYYQFYSVEQHCGITLCRLCETMNVDLHPYLTYVGTTAQTLSSWKKTPANYGSKVWAKITEITHYEYATKTLSI